VQQRPQRAPVGGTPVATTESATIGPQVSGSALVQGFVAAAASAMPIANAKPQCRLGTAASGL
jgi:hypothetical protein